MVGQWRRDLVRVHQKSSDLLAPLSPPLASVTTFIPPFRVTMSHNHSLAGKGEESMQPPRRISHHSLLDTAPSTSLVQAAALHSQAAHSQSSQDTTDGAPRSAPTITGRLSRHDLRSLIDEAMRLVEHIDAEDGPAEGRGRNADDSPGRNRRSHPGRE